MHLFCVRAVYLCVFKELFSLVMFVLLLFVSSEAPEEEEVDRRCLYERLQEQKDRKQAEHDEQHKLSKQFLIYVRMLLR